MEIFPSLTVSPSAIIERHKDSTIRSPFEAGYTQTRKRSTRNNIKEFEVTYIAMPTTDKNVLTTFLEHSSVNLGAGAWEWTHPLAASTHTVKFQTLPEFQTITEAPGWYSTKFIIEEV